MDNNVQSVEDLNQKACQLWQAADYQAALELFNQAIACESCLPKLWNNRGNVLCDIGRYAEALASYDRAVALKPDYHQAWYNRGVVLKELGAYGNALESFQRAIQIHPDPLYFHRQEDIWLKKKLIQV
jgi:tetratricopeptide (TPR) repeat protein